MWQNKKQTLSQSIKNNVWLNYINKWKSPMTHKERIKLNFFLMEAWNYLLYAMKKKPNYTNNTASQTSFTQFSSTHRQRIGHNVEPWNHLLPHVKYNNQEETIEQYGKLNKDIKKRISPRESKLIKETFSKWQFMCIVYRAEFG